MIQCTGTRYILQAEELAKETAGGIIVNYSGATQFARIVAVGPRVQDALPVGTRVAVEWQHTVPIKHQDQDYYVIESKCVMAEVL